MFEDFHPRGIVPLVIAMTSLWDAFAVVLDPRGAMQDFGFPAWIANTPACYPVFVMTTVRMEVIGVLLFTFYAREQLEVVDTILAVTGLYLGAMDSLLLWRAHRSRQAFRHILICFTMAIWGLAGCTSTWDPWGQSS